MLCSPVGGGDTAIEGVTWACAAGGGGDRGGEDFVPRQDQGELEGGTEPALPLCGRCSLKCSGSADGDSGGNLQM